MRATGFSESSEDVYETGRLHIQETVFFKQKSFHEFEKIQLTLNIKKLRGLSPQANYTDRAAAAGRRS